MMIRPCRPGVGLQGDRSRIDFVVIIFSIATLVQDLFRDQLCEKFAKILELLRESGSVGWVGIEAV